MYFLVYGSLEHINSHSTSMTNYVICLCNCLSPDSRKCTIKPKWRKQDSDIYFLTFRCFFPCCLSVCLSVCDYFPLNYCDVMREKGVKINVNTFLKISLSFKNLMIERKIQGLYPISHLFSLFLPNLMGVVFTSYVTWCRKETSYLRGSQYFQLNKRDALLIHYNYLIAIKTMQLTICN